MKTGFPLLGFQTLGTLLFQNVGFFLFFLSHNTCLFTRKRSTFTTGFVQVSISYLLFHFNIYHRFCSGVTFVYFLPTFSFLKTFDFLIFCGRLRLFCFARNIKVFYFLRNKTGSRFEVEKSLFSLFWGIGLARRNF